MTSQTPSGPKPCHEILRHVTLPVLEDAPRLLVLILA